MNNDKIDRTNILKILLLKAPRSSILTRYSPPRRAKAGERGSKYLEWREETKKVNIPNVTANQRNRNRISFLFFSFLLVDRIPISRRIDQGKKCLTIIPK
jgi:hypothetical protein